MRVLGLPLVLVTLAVGGFVFYQHSKSSNGPTAPAITQMETQASIAVATTNFSSAAEVLQGYYAQNGSYAGATLPPGTGVIIVKADDAGFCLQSADGATNEHEYGPGGQVQPGPC
jgi:hypothetical protein